MDDDTFNEIERRYQIAEARFEVADQFGWGIALLSSAIIILKWDNWLYAIITFIVTFIIVTYRERREYNIASKLYENSGK